jgi:hypothetical protein
MAPLVTRSVRGNALKLFLGVFSILADFAIFSGFLN